MQEKFIPNLHMAQLRLGGVVFTFEDTVKIQNSYLGFLL